MKIYTRTGDGGTTGLFGGARVEKDSPRVEALGSVDELNASLGVARAALRADREDAFLARIQADLFAFGAELACAPGREDRLGIQVVGAEDAARLEAWIDELEAGLPPLANFILPGGSPAGASLHHARTVCRRAERAVLAAGREGAPSNALVVYLNRLGDFLFVLARHVNKTAGVGETPWSPRSGPEK